MRKYVKLPPLEIEEELANALNAYTKQLGVPRARVLREIIRGFLGPMAQARPKPASANGGYPFDPSGES